MQGIDSIFYVVVLIASIVLHEVAHGYVAYAMGDKTALRAGRLTLNPLVHLEWFGSVILPLVLVLSGTGLVLGWAKPVPYDPGQFRNVRWGTLAVALAGVVVNFILAIVFGLLYRFAPVFGFGVAIQSLFLTIVIVNIVLGVFNLVPIPPLDGSKVLFSILPPSYGHMLATLERYSLPLIIFFVFFGWKIIQPIIYFLFTLITSASL